MPLFKRLRWENPQESCGPEITTNSLRHGEKAWFAVGLVLEKFENEIEHSVTIVLSNIGCEHANLYVRVYMIGKSQLVSRPVIMVCCLNNGVRALAKDALRGSHIRQTYSQFDIGSVARPLEQPLSARAFAGGMDYLDAISFKTPNDAVFSSSVSPIMGRHLFRPGDNSDLTLWATGGVLLQIEDTYYQLTTEHVSSDHLEDDEEGLDTSSDADLCSIDGADDEDGDEDETSQTDLDVLSHGSATPEPSLVSPSFISLEQSNGRAWEDESSIDGSDTEHEYTTFSPPKPVGNFDTFNTPGTSLGSRYHHIPSAKSQSLPNDTSLVKIGMISIKASEGSCPGLDYSLIVTEPPGVTDLINGVILSREAGQKFLGVLKVAAREPQEKPIFLVSDSSCVMRGTLLPGTTLFRRKDLKSFQRLQIVQLEGAVAEGDCGATVIDQVTGAFYGHLVRGCPGIGTAYIVPAMEIFQDLLSRGFLARLASFNNNKPRPEGRYGSSQSRLSNHSSPQSTLTPGLQSLSQSQKQEPESRVSSWSKEFSATIPRRSNSSEWPDIFTSRRDVSLLWLNSSFFQEFQDTPSDDFWDAFLGSTAMSSTSFHRSSELRLFCHNATVDALESQQHQKPTIWLDQREFKSLRARPFQGILSAGQLVTELRRNRYEPTSQKVNKIDADKRLIYVSDLDEWTALALAITCSEPETKALSDILYKHIALKPSFGVSISTRACKTFLLEFNLPFFTWRKHDQPVRDHRHNPEGKPLRRSLNLKDFFPKHFDLKKPTTRRSLHEVSAHYFLHEAQFSCSVVGIDETRWTAYFFEDAFFGSRDDSMSLIDYESDAKDGIILDPLVLGSLEAHTSIWSPRDYFLAVLNIRFKQVAEEWTHMTSQLEKAVFDQVSSRNIISHFEQDQDAEFGKISTSLTLTTWLMAHLVQTVSNILDAWSSFEKHQLTAFFDDSHPDQASANRPHVIDDIRGSVSRLRDCHRTINNLNDTCKNSFDLVQRELIAAQIRGATPLPEVPTSNSLQTLTFIAFLFLPLSLTATLFSMDSQAIIFQPSPKAFVVLASSITVAMLIYVMMANKYFGPVLRWTRRIFHYMGAKVVRLLGSMGLLRERLYDPEPELQGWAYQPEPGHRPTSDSHLPSMILRRPRR
ncbi:hypothetical protein EsH8_I_001500 [Colletotrichum jinshuiense]